MLRKWRGNVVGLRMGLPTDADHPDSNYFMRPGLADDYAPWRLELLRLRNAPLRHYTSSRAIHIAMETQAYEHNPFTESGKHYRTFDIMSSGSRASRSHHGRRSG